MVIVTLKEKTIIVYSTPEIYIELPTYIISWVSKYKTFLAPMQVRFKKNSYEFLKKSSA